MKALDEILLDLHAGQMGSALEALARFTQDQFSEHEELNNHCITILARYNQLRRRRMAHTISGGEARVAENQIRFSTIEMMGVLNDELQGYEGELQTNASGPGSDKRLRILFLPANPNDNVQLVLANEVKAIADALARGCMDDRFELRSCGATQPAEMTEELIHFQPEFVHFAGKGDRGGILTVDALNEEFPIPEAKLGEVFERFQQMVACVVLSACYATEQANSIHRHIPHVIGTVPDPENQGAAKFSALFYTAIAEGQEISFAFELARLGVGELGDGNHFEMVL
jgi:hypothetical protein